MNYVGRFINHDDKVETDKLSSAFDITAALGRQANRFNMEYTHCGCHLPGQTIGQKLRHLFNKHTVDVSRLTPPTRDNLLATTRQSNRNAVSGDHYKGSISEQKRWWKKLGRQQTQDMGRADPKRAEWDIGHNPAFLVPVPISFTSNTAPATSRSAPTGNAASGREGGSSAHKTGASTCGGCGNGGGEGGDCGGGDCGGGGCGGCGGCGG
ncbi:hypothetical protein BD779DRAFT_1532560 [Infundibulicybe gibba]|nr:hypothetical protein BD779DRAFT_1532560 [Infundibulicybe gibba]